MSRMVLTPRLGVLVPDDETDGDLERHGVGHAALLALVDVVLQLHPDRVAADVTDVAAGLVLLAAARAEHLVIAVRIGNQRRAAVAAGLPQVVQAGQLAALALPVADRILDELERRVLAEVADREDRLEDRLQPRILALGRQAVHLQEPLVRLPLNLDQVRDGNGGLDLRKILALAVDVLRKAVHRLLVLEARTRDARLAPAQATLRPTPNLQQRGLGVGTSDAGVGSISVRRSKPWRRLPRTSS